MSEASFPAYCTSRVSVLPVDGNGNYTGQGDTTLFCGNAGANQFNSPSRAVTPAQQGQRVVIGNTLVFQNPS